MTCLPGILFLLGLACLIKGQFNLPAGRRVNAPVGRAAGVLMLIGILLYAVSELGQKIALGLLVFAIFFALVASEKVPDRRPGLRAADRPHSHGGLAGTQRVILAALIVANCLVYAIAVRLMLDRWRPSLPGGIALPWSTVESTALPLPTPAPIDHQALIRQAYEQYRAALLVADGEAAASLVDRQTRQWYDEAWAQALALPAEELDRQSLYRKIVVIFFRHSFTRSELEAARTRGAYALAVEQGLVSLTGIEATEIATIAVQGHLASVSFVSEPEGTALHLVLEDGSWKFALWKSFPTLELVLKQVMAEMGLSEREMIVALIESSSRFYVDEHIFEGPRE